MARRRKRRQGQARRQFLIFRHGHGDAAPWKCRHATGTAARLGSLQHESRQLQSRRQIHSPRTAHSLGTLVITPCERTMNPEASMSAISRRTFLRNAGATATAASFLAAAGALRLRANPLGMPIGCQTWPVRDMIAKDFPGTIKQLA